MQRLIDLYKDVLNLRLNLKNKTEDVEHTQEQLSTEYEAFRLESVKGAIRHITSELTSDFIPLWEDENWFSVKWNFELEQEKVDQKRLDLQSEINSEKAKRDLIEDVESPEYAGYTMSINALESELNALVDIPVITKPDLVTLLDFWESWMVQLDDERIAREAEEARVKDLTDRFNACMLDMNGMWLETGKPHIANPAILLKDIIKDNDTTLLEELEEAEGKRKIKADKKNAKQEILEKGRAKKVLCECILDLIRGYNTDNGFSEAEIDSLEVAYEDIVNALEKGRPTKAKKMIEAVDDASLATLKEMLLEEFAENGY